jgi:hypothetical protein
MVQGTSPTSDADSGGPGSSPRTATALRDELDALRSRRAVRLALLLTELVKRPRRILRLPWLLAEALRPAPRTTARQGRGGRGGGVQLTAPARRPRYPHLRVAHLGGEATPFAGVAPAVRLDPEGWKAQLDEQHVDLVYVVPGAPGWRLSDLVDTCADLGVPTVFAPRGARDLALLDGAQPTLIVDEGLDLAPGPGRAEHILDLLPATDLRRFNPVGWVREPEHTAMLVAARAPDPARAADLAAYVAAAGDDLTVYVTPEVEVGRLPDSMTAGRVETVEGPAAIAAAARTHRVALAHPSLHPSPAAYRRHVLDLTACGTPTIHPADGVLARSLPSELRQDADGPSAVSARLAGLVDPDERERVSVPARRHVLQHHTTRARFDEILTRLGIPTARVPTISILLCTNRPDRLEHAHAQIARQDHPALEIITVCHGDGFDIQRVERLAAGHPHPSRVLQAPAHWTLGDALNLALDHATGDLVTKMDDDDLYGPSHLSDLVLALTYSRADVVGKLGNFVYLSERDVTMDRYLVREESFVWHLPGATLLTHREVLQAYRFSRVRSAVDTTLYERLHRDGARRYSTHRFNFVRFRGDQHTYARTDEEFLEQAEHCYPGLALDRTEL